MPPVFAKPDTLEVVLSLCLPMHSLILPCLFNGDGWVLMVLFQSKQFVCLAGPLELGTV